MKQLVIRGLKKLHTTLIQIAQTPVFCHRAKQMLVAALFKLSIDQTIDTY